MATINQLMEEIARVNQFRYDINRAEDPQERAPHYQGLAEVLSLEDQAGQRVVSQDVFDNLYRDIGTSPEEAVRCASEGLAAKAHSANDEYQENTDQYVDAVVEAMNNIVGDSDDLPQTLEDLFDRYFGNTGLMQIQKLDQDQLDNRARARVAQVSGVRSFRASGNRQAYESIEKRRAMSQFINREETDDGVTYVVNRDAVAEWMQDIRAGSVLYTTSQNPE